MNSVATGVENNPQEKRLVVGLGATGLSTMRHLQRMGLAFKAFDQHRPAEDSAFWECAQEIIPSEDLYFENEMDVVAEADRIYLSPGISPTAPWLLANKQRRAIITGDLDLFAGEAQAPVIAITGSNGKSTVTTLVAEILRAAGYQVAVGGNLGTPMLDLLAESVEVYVLELSSFQLERSDGLKNHIACILNISDDHLDRHGSIENYRNIKHKIYESALVCVYSRQDSLTYPAVSSSAKAMSFGEDFAAEEGFGVREEDGVLKAYKDGEVLFSSDEVCLFGAHNFQNLLAACVLASAFQVDTSIMTAICKQFKGLDHRCQKVAELGGVAFVNDSKATNVGSAIASMKAVARVANTDSTIHIILGGVAKGADFGPLIEVCASFGVEYILIGEASAQIAESIPLSATRCFAKDMEDAVIQAYRNASAGDTVLLAPACASFDMFENYMQRGDAFVDVVSQLNGSSVGAEHLGGIASEDA